MGRDLCRRNGGQAEPGGMEILLAPRIVYRAAIYTDISLNTSRRRTADRPMLAAPGTEIMGLTNSVGRPSPGAKP